MSDASGARSAAGASSPALAPPPGNPRFALFDSARGLAALVVVAAHAVVQTGALYDAEWRALSAPLGFAVPVLFLISGFLLYRPFVRARVVGGRRVSVRRFARRRVLRVVPAYWVAFALLLLWPGLPAVTGDNWWRYFVFGQIYSQETLFGGIGPAWTLCADAAFYAMLPIWAMLAARLSDRISGRNALHAEVAALATLSIASLVLRHFVDAAYATGYPLPNYSLLGTFAPFAAGMAFALVSVEDEAGRPPPRILRTLSGRPGWCWLAAGVVYLWLAAGMGKRLVYLPTDFWYVVIASLLLLPAVFERDGAGFPRRLLATRTLGWVGMIAYGLYLYHRPLMRELHERGVGTDGPLIAGTLELALVSMLVAIAAGAASYYVIELPFLRRKKH